MRSNRPDPQIVEALKKFHELTEKHGMDRKDLADLELYVKARLKQAGVKPSLKGYEM